LFEAVRFLFLDGPFLSVGMARVKMRWSWTIPGPAPSAGGNATAVIAGKTCEAAAVIAVIFMEISYYGFDL
jgi:hypothetical protein